MSESAVEAEPDAASTVFGDRLPVLRAFAADLAEHGVELGLIGPLEPARIWTRHILNSGLLAELLVDGDRVADVGSGAGLPGLVLAAARPGVHFTLIEPMLRRTEWLVAETQRLGLANVTVLRGRAEEVPRRSYDVVTARAVGAVEALLPITVPLLVPGGSLLLMKGAGVDGELARARAVIARMKLVDLRVDILGAGMATEATRVLRATVHTTSS